MAGTTGLEPATSAVTGQRSNQLSYVPRSFFNNRDGSFAGNLSARTYCFSCPESASVLGTIPTRSPHRGNTLSLPDQCFDVSAGFTTIVSCISMSPVPASTFSFSINCSTFSGVSMNSTFSGRRSDISTKLLE